MSKKIPETITEDEFSQILKIVKNPKTKIAYILGFYGAMRVSEIINLKPENIDRGQKIIRIKDAKGGKDRNIPLPPEAVKGLSYLPIGVTVRALQYSISKHAFKALGRKIHYHTLRHSGATYYLNKKKWSTRQVQVLLGHSRVSTTEIYTHVTPQDLIDKMWGQDNQ